MSSLVEDVCQALLGKCHLMHGESVVVAVSGGLDSMVLLDLLQRLAPEQGWRIIVAHFNHQLRGGESDGDQEFVAHSAHALGLPFETAGGEVQRHSQQKAISIEMAARELRHRFLARVARKQDAVKIALGHHANDQVETFFLRLLRGAGGDGLRGMRFASPSPADPTLQLVRPLLHTARQALAEYARAGRIRFRRDATNAALDPQRNWIRHRLLPLLERRIQPALNTTVLRVMDILGAEAEYVAESARSWLAGKDGRAFDSLHPALQRKAIQAQLGEVGIPANFELVEQLRAAANRSVMTRPGRRVWRDTAGRVQAGEVVRLEFDPDCARFELAGGEGSLRFGGLEVRWKVVRPKAVPFNVPRMAGCEYFDAERVGEGIVLRHWQPGDRFQPIGQPQDAKLQDLFTNLKVARAERRTRVLAALPAGEIFWVEGLRIAEPFKVRTGTRCRLEWRWQRVSQRATERLQPSCANGRFGQSPTGNG